MKVGQYIIFFLEVWENDIYTLKKVKSIVLDICNDPMKLHESKCGVKINGEAYGIPFSEIIEIFSGVGEQLELKF